MLLSFLPGIFLFEDKNFHDHFCLFNKLLLNIFHNFIPNKILIKDLPWLNDEIGVTINNKNVIYRKHIHNGILQPDCNSLASISDTLVGVLRYSKEKYYSDLSDRLKTPFTSAKTYWIVLKTFVNDRKVLTVPILLVDGKIGI